MAWALLELAALTGGERFRTAALAAIAYERSLFSAEARNWPDLRDPEIVGRGANGRPGFMTAWCHGAPGIGLARLRGLPHLDGAPARAEIEVALRTTLAHGFGTNHSLCHGDLGNLELLLQAGETLAEQRWRAEADRRAALVLDDIERRGWACGLPGRVESPGLMTGLAGIGYGLLRLAAPERVPSVLLLDAPAKQEDPTKASSHRHQLPPADRLGPLPRESPHQPGGPLVAGAADAEGLPPDPHRPLAGTSPVHHGRGRFVPHGAGQLVTDQQAGPATGGVQGAAARPGDARVGPAGDDDRGIAVQAG
jgi:hypothetical protein